MTITTIGGALAGQFLTNGKLRASINLGNPMLAGRHPASSAPTGVSVDLAEEFARRLGVETDLVEFSAAGKAAEALAEGTVNLGFIANDPQRGEGIRFSAPYLLIEGSYLVHADSPLVSNDQVDQPGIRVAVGRGSAYDLYLARTLQHAQLVRAATSPTTVDTFIEQGLEVAAGVRQQLEHDATRIDGLRVLDGRFMTIQQAMGIPRHCSDGAWRLLCAFVEEMKQTGFVAASLARHGIGGAAVAPLAA
jgi:polar amino acid transport system substrate-binding protein